MKQIIENRFLKGICFSSSSEAITFFNNQKVKRKLSIEETFGEYYYCYICSHSLTREKQFILLFSSDESEDNLNFIFWENSLVLDTGRNIYLIDENLTIKASFELSTALIGLYLVNKERLLLLEEDSLRVMDTCGQIVQYELFDLIEDFNIKNSVLTIKTEEENRVINLV